MFRITSFNLVNIHTSNVIFVTQNIKGKLKFLRDVKRNFECNVRDIIEMLTANRK